MSLRTKNASKWMKRQLRHGGNLHEETRAAVAEQQQNVEKLKQRMESVKRTGRDGGDDEDDDDESIDEEDEEALQKCIEGLEGLSHSTIC